MGCSVAPLQQRDTTSTRKCPPVAAAGGDAHPGRSENGAYGSLREGVGCVFGSGSVGGPKNKLCKMFLNPPPKLCKVP